MKKNILIGVLLLQILTLVVVSYVKASEATKAKLEALNQAEYSREMQVIAERQAAKH